MFHFAVYDDAGNIIMRVKTSRRIRSRRQNHIELTEGEYHAKPELTMRVDMAHLRATGQKRLKGKDEPD